MSPPPVVAVVGAGIAGAACARALADAGVAVEVLDRGRAPGGRLASPRVEGRPVDLGGSYLTVRDEGFRAVVEDWVARGLAHPWTTTFSAVDADGSPQAKPGPLRYGTAGGLRSLVRDLLTGLPVQQAVEVQSVGPGPSVDGTAYAAVVLAMPDPQAERLLDPVLTAELAAVADRQWEPVLALAAGFDTRTWAVDGVFVAGSPVLAWVADDGRRRGDDAPVLVAHSTSPFARRHLDDPDAAGPALLAALRALLPLPTDPQWIRLQRWTFARPADGREESFHLGASRVGLCGDGWGSPRVETAWVSGTRLGQALAASL